MFPVVEIVNSGSVRKTTVQNKEAVPDSLPTEGPRNSFHTEVFHRVADVARLIRIQRIPAKDMANMSGSRKNQVRSSEERIGQNCWGMGFGRQ